MGKAAKKAKKEERKQSGMPKRPPSAFWLWQTETRDALIKEAGTNKIGVIGKRAAALKAEHVKEMAEWKASNATAAEDQGDDDDEEVGNDSESPQKNCPGRSKA